MLNIKTEEVDRLAQDLAELTGESVGEAVTVAVRERLERMRSAVLDERAPASETPEEFVRRISRLTAALMVGVDRRPVTQEEWIEAGGDDLDLEMLAAEKRRG